MRIIKYKTELNEDRVHMLVKEYACNYPSNNLNTPDKIVEMMNGVFHLQKQTEEYFYMIAFNTKMRPIGIFEISHGAVNYTVCGSREIFSKALLIGATFITLIHNHPSLEATPSAEDYKSYETLKQAGEILGVPIIDNIIIGKGYYSFYEAEHKS